MKRFANKKPLQRLTLVHHSNIYLLPDISSVFCKLATGLLLALKLVLWNTETKRLSHFSHKKQHVYYYHYTTRLGLAKKGWLTCSFMLHTVSIIQFYCLISKMLLRQNMLEWQCATCATTTGIWKLRSRHFPKESEDSSTTLSSPFKS